MDDTLKNVIFSLSNIPEIVAMYEYGSSTYQYEKTVPKASEEFMDLLIVTHRKNPSLKNLIDKVLCPHAIVVHHPDFYIPRIAPRPYIELVVLPVGSHYLANQDGGILLGLSGFVLCRYETLYGPKKICDLLQLPDNPRTSAEVMRDPSKLETGIRDYLEKLWPLIGVNENQCDIRRVAKYFFMDCLWVIEGIFEADRKNIVIKASQVFSSILAADERTLLSYINKDFEPALNNRLTSVLYETISKVATHLKTLNQSVPFT